ncbi:MAG: T9SS type A sorting domain-containing protein, partial [Chitinophagaceae bacterium]|nr:T9SS type A sorting domain-containing protein [Chitinophagaceae bacterium]
IISGNVAPVVADVDAPLTVLDSVTASIIEDLYYPKGLLVTPTPITTDIFTDTLTNEYTLAPMSQAIDAGDSSFFNVGMIPDLSLVTTDADGLDRIMGKNIDLGAFESCDAIIAATVSVAAAPGTTVATGTSVTFTATATNPGATPTYMWLKNNTMIISTSTPTYTGVAGVDFASGDIISVALFPSIGGPCVDGDSTSSNKLTMTIPTTGIPEWDKNGASLSVVPNPNNGSFALKVSGINGKQVNLTVTDITGRAVFTESFTGSNAAKTMNLNGKIPAGTYILSLEGDEVSRQVKRFVIE